MSALKNFLKQDIGAMMQASQGRVTEQLASSPEAEAFLDPKKVQKMMLMATAAVALAVGSLGATDANAQGYTTQEQSQMVRNVGTLARGAMSSSGVNHQLSNPAVTVAQQATKVISREGPMTDADKRTITTGVGTLVGAVAGYKMADKKGVGAVVGGAGGALAGVLLGKQIFPGNDAGHSAPKARGQAYGQPLYSAGDLGMPPLMQGAYMNKGLLASGTVHPSAEPMVHQRMELATEGVVNSIRNYSSRYNEWAAAIDDTSVEGQRRAKIIAQDAIRIRDGMEAKLEIYREARNQAAGQFNIDVRGFDAQVAEVAQYAPLPTKYKNMKINYNVAMGGPSPN